jgi:ABC-type nitrate/sulfonate/bicarbonate transport system substrate-binding protein
MKKLFKKSATYGVGLLTMTVVLAACGSSSTSSKPSNSSKASKSPSTPTLNVAIASNTTLYGPVWVAAAKGLFAKDGVNVHLLTNTEAGTASLLTSGRADIAMFTTAFPLELAREGQNAVIIYNTTNTVVPAVITPPSIKSLAQLQSLSSCRMNTPTVGSVFYGTALAFKSYYHIKCSIVPLSSVSVQVPGVTSGQYQASLVIADAAEPAVLAGKANLIVNPLHLTASERTAFEPRGSYPSLVAFGIKSNLDAKRVAVTRFVKALYQAGALIDSYSSSALGTMTVNQLSSDLPGLTQKSATYSWDASKQSIPQGTSRGFISASLWQKTLKGVGTWGISNFTPSSATNSYAKRVDMSFYNAAVKTSS